MAIKATTPIILERYDLEHIYNTEETGLFYRATPNGSLMYMHQELVGSKKAMDRVTVLCGCNVTGMIKDPF